MRWCGIVLGGIGILLAALLAVPLTAPTANSRGADELIYSLYGQLPFQGAGTLYDQPVNLQRPGVSELSIPYWLAGTHSARTRVWVTQSDGAVLLNEVRDLPPTGTFFGPNFQLDSSYWDGQQAGWTRVAVSAVGNPSQLTIHFERLDAAEDGFFFYTNPAIATNKAPLSQNHDIAIVVQTGYGALRPAVLKAPSYSERVNSLAPPWLGGILPEVLGSVLLLGGLLALAVTLWGPEAPSSKLDDR